MNPRCAASDIFPNRARTMKSLCPSSHERTECEERAPQAIVVGGHDEIVALPRRQCTTTLHFPPQFEVPVRRPCDDVVSRGSASPCLRRISPSLSSNVVGGAQPRRTLIAKTVGLAILGKSATDRSRARRSVAARFVDRAPQLGGNPREDVLERAVRRTLGQPFDEVSARRGIDIVLQAVEQACVVVRNGRIPHLLEQEGHSRPISAYSLVVSSSVTRYRCHFHRRTTRQDDRGGPWLRDTRILTESAAPVVRGEVFAEIDTPAPRNGMIF